VSNGTAVPGLEGVFARREIDMPLFDGFPPGLRRFLAFEAKIDWNPRLIADAMGEGMHPVDVVIELRRLEREAGLR